MPSATSVDRKRLSANDRDDEPYAVRQEGDMVQASPVPPKRTTVLGPVHQTVNGRIQHTFSAVEIDGRILIDDPRITACEISRLPGDSTQRDTPRFLMG